MALWHVQKAAGSRLIGMHSPVHLVLTALTHCAKPYAGLITDICSVSSLSTNCRLFRLASCLSQIATVKVRKFIVCNSTRCLTRISPIWDVQTLQREPEAQSFGICRCSSDFGRPCRGRQPGHALEVAQAGKLRALMAASGLRCGRRAGASAGNLLIWPPIAVVAHSYSLTGE